MVKPDNPPKGKGRAPSSAPSKLPPPSNNRPPSPQRPSNPNSDQHPDTQQQDPLARVTRHSRRVTRHSRLSAANTASSTSTSSAWTQNLLPEEGSASQDTASSRASTSSRRSSLRDGRGSSAAEERVSPARAEEEREAREEGASWRASSSESPRPSTSSQAGPSRSTRRSLSKPISNESPAHPSSSKASGSAIPSSSSSSLKRLPSKLNRSYLRPSPPLASSSKRATSSSSSLSSSSTHQPYPTPTSNDANSPLGLNPASPARADNNVEVEVASSSRAARARNSNIRKAVEEATALSSSPSLNSSVEAGSDVLEAGDVAEGRGTEQDDDDDEDVLIVEAEQEDEGEGEVEQEYSEAESEPSPEELERRRLAAIEEEETQMRLEDDFDDINEWTDQLLTKKHCYPTFPINSSVYTRPKRIPSSRCSVEQILRFASPDPELDQEPFDLFGAEDSPARSSAEPAAPPSSRKRALPPKVYSTRSSPAKRRLTIASDSTTALDLPQPSSSKRRSTLPSSSAPKPKPSRNAVASSSTSIPIRIAIPADLRRRSVPAQPKRVASASPSLSDHSDASSTVSYSRAVSGVHYFAYVLVPEHPELAERDRRRRDKGKGREVIVIEDTEEEDEEEQEDEETLRRRKAKGKGRAVLDEEEEEEEEEAPKSASRSRSSSELIEVEDEDEGDDEGDDEESDRYDEDDDVYVDLGGDEDVNMGSENEEQGFRLRERSRKGKETGIYSRKTKRKESLNHAPRSDSSYEDDMERETTRYAPESSVSHDSDSSDIIVLSPLSSSAYDPPPSEPKRPPTARKTRPSSIALIEIQVSPELSIHLLQVEDHYLRTDPRGDPIDETQYSLVTNETGFTQLVPYLPLASSSCTEEVAEEGSSPMEVEQELDLVQPSPKVDETAMDSNDDDDEGGEVVLFQPFSRGAFKDRPRKKSFTTGRSEEGGDAMEVDEEMRPRGETEGAMSRTGRISKKKTFYGENSDEDNPSVASASTSLLPSQPLPDTQPKSKPRRKSSNRFNASYPPGATSCHQCRRGTLHPKATCIDCELRYCKPCLASRYGLTFEDTDLETFSCPTCHGFCNCSLCLNKKGYRGRAGAFRGVQIRCYLAGAVHGTDLSIMALLDSKVEEAGGQAAWSMIEGSEDMQGMLDAVSKRMRERDGRRESTELESSVEARQTRTTIVESERPGRLFGRLKGGDAEVDLASLVGENGARKGKGKTVDSDGETVDSYHSDPEDPEPEPEAEVTIDDEQDAVVSTQHLEDVPSFLYPHRPTDEVEDEDEDEPEPLVPPPPPTFQQLSANRFESPTKLSLAPKSFSDMTDEEMRIKWEPDDDATVPYLSEPHQPNDLFPPSSPLASTSNSLFPPATTPSSLPNPDAPLPSLLYSSDEAGCYSPQSTNQTTPDQSMEDIDDGTGGGPSSSFREGSSTPLPPIFESSSTIPLLPAVPWDSEGTLGEEYRNMITGATLA